MPARSCGTYRYQAVEYTIEQPDGKVILLRSRGSGNGTAQPFFNIYIQDPYAGDGTTALRGDPVQGMLRATGEGWRLFSE